VFVETIVIYSDAYRKAKKAQDRARALDSEEAREKIRSKDEKTAKDQTGSRKGEPVLEATESAPAA
jgi:hypothetical protein